MNVLEGCAAVAGRCLPGGDVAGTLGDQLVAGLCFFLARPHPQVQSAFTWMANLCLFYVVDLNAPWIAPTKQRGV